MKIKMYADIQRSILETIGNTQPESGGILGCCKDNVITAFYFDEAAGTGKRSYIPTTKAIEHQINEVWYPLGFEFGGLIHSHPDYATPTLSTPDIQMAEKIMRHNQLKQLILIVVYRKTLYTWLTYFDQQDTIQLLRCTIEII